MLSIPKRRFSPRKMIPSLFSKPLVLLWQNRKICPYFKNFVTSCSASSNQTSPGSPEAIFPLHIQIIKGRHSLVKKMDHPAHQLVLLQAIDLKWFEIGGEASSSQNSYLMKIFKRPWPGEKLHQIPHRQLIPLILNYFFW